jgi:hypothetical protein
MAKDSIYLHGGGGFKSLSTYTLGASLGLVM